MRSKLNDDNWDIEEILKSIQETEKKSIFNSKYYELFKKAWNDNKYSRLALWLTLTWWAIAATASWAWAIAWVIFATRASLSAIWWFITTEAIFDIIDSKLEKDHIQNLYKKLLSIRDKNERIVLLNSEISNGTYSCNVLKTLIKNVHARELNKKKVKMLLSASVWAILWILWLSKLSIFTEWQKLTETKELYSNKINAIINPPKTDSAMTKMIFDDIKNDHPWQKYITLEQSVRRIEWLKRWIPLDESYRLNSMNSEIAEMIRSDDSNIIKTAKKLWYLKSWEGFDQFAKKLTDDKISKILETSYSEDKSSVISNMVPQNIQEYSSMLSLDKNKKIMVWMAWIWGLWALAYKLKKSLSRKNKTSNKDKWNQIEITDFTNEISKNNSISEDFIIPENREITISKALNENFWMNKISLSKEQLLKYSKPTIWWEFEFIYKEIWNKCEIEILWINENRIKSHLRTWFLINSEIEKFKEDFNFWINEIIEEIFIERDRIKNKEIAEGLNKVFIKKEYLQDIYSQLENSYVIENSLETWWYFFQNIYWYKSQSLELMNLWNPTLEEMNITTWSFAIKEDKMEKYNLRYRFSWLMNQFDEFEANIIANMVIKYKNRWIWNILPWALMALNWHKHPWNLYHPSIEDINSEYWAKSLFISNPHQMMNFWWIVNSLDSRTNDTNKPENSIILRWKDYWWYKNYIMYFWKIKRNPDWNYSIFELEQIEAKQI